uniref:Tyr recombinase domain-containing protein n=1 Tax=uncultured prokaryote TaxID=198431 RepID=A0A0H5QEJ8_9ZZZZ|nr:hypothetical protein [uncultured prokaryote]
MTIQQAFEDFMLEQKVRGNSPKTQEYYSGALRLLLTYCGPEQEMAALTLAQLRHHYLALTEKGLSTTTIQSYVRAWRAFLTWCYQEGYIAADLPQKFRLPKAKRPTIDVLTDREVQQLFSSFDTKHLPGLRNYCICALMLDSGLRMDEVVTLETEHVHLAEGYAIVCGKGNKERMVPLGNRSRQMLARYLRRRGPVDNPRLFQTSQHTPIRQTTVKQLFRKLKKRLNIPRLRAHLLRHTFATRYLENGGDMYSLQQILGHTSLEMVKRYVHLTHQKTVAAFPQFSPLDRLAR